MTPERRAAYEADLQRALDAGSKILAEGGDAMDAIKAAIIIMEDSPLFNAGKDEQSPSACYSLIGYDVPCGNLSYAAAAATTGAVAVLLLSGTPGRTSLLGLVVAAVIAAVGIGLVIAIW